MSADIGRAPAPSRAPRVLVRFSAVADRRLRGLARCAQPPQLRVAAFGPWSWLWR
ncbi:hypothetical protein [Nocardiopsis quinghaiensis]|uniref:hypothetical protein n=1 Tax=Nocardiopsis quinghaiensis TaxID=464995 RepID=UPI00167FEF49|nr:hypothetical protein [Nocardiopsis quinghaiensis]